MTTTTVPVKRASETTGQKIGGWAGAVGTVLFFGMGMSIMDGPAIGDPAGEMRQWFADNEGTVALFTWAMPGVMVLYLVFAAALRGVLLRADERTGGVLPRAGFGAAVAGAAAGVAGLSLWGALANESVLSAISDDTMQAIAGIDTVLFFGIMPWLDALFLGSAAIVILQSGVMPKWLGALGCVVAVATALSGLWLLSGDPGNFFGAGLGTIGFLGARVWTLATAVFLIRSREIDVRT